MTLHLETWQKRLLIVLAGALLVSLFVLAFVAGQIGTGTDHPSGTSADAGFARDMQIHHTQAVEMSRLVRDRTDDEVVRTIAYDIAMTQQHQIGQMYAWLEEWGLPQSSSAPNMAWMAGSMDHHTGGSMLEPNGLMPGMATAEQLQELADASGVEAERIFLTLMITHHEAGAEMAQAGAELAQEPRVKGAAEKMAVAQVAEITAMEDMLDKL
ncbi:DUF305 domain-containing protein [Arthrobacter sp. Bz4]|uniref:DUF305 domain-containing protein n=1 Tax=Arthrobacter sp. Bz4 TaxID=2171979 RepID=UPI000D50FEDB|nr:DUF305 domain-containing protein [Arthrobacter sp. Bz4]PVE19682.1 DUF305 domain-containing protein [Arthrobacter sp. Bz4]